MLAGSKLNERAVMRSIAIVACVALAACGYTERLGTTYNNAFLKSTEQLMAERDAADDMRCRSFGAMPGTAVYVQCRVGLDQARAARSAFPAAGGAALPPSPEAGIENGRSCIGYTVQTQFGPQFHCQ